MYYQLNLYMIIIMSITTVDDVTNITDWITCNDEGTNVGYKDVNQTGWYNDDFVKF